VFAGHPKILPHARDYCRGFDFVSGRWVPALCTYYRMPPIRAPDDSVVRTPVSVRALWSEWAGIAGAAPLDTDILLAVAKANDWLLKPPVEHRS